MSMTPQVLDELFAFIDADRSGFIEPRELSRLRHRLAAPEPVQPVKTFATAMCMTDVSGSDIDEEVRALRAACDEMQARCEAAEARARAADDSAAQATMAAEAAKEAERAAKTAEETARQEAKVAREHEAEAIDEARAAKQVAEEARVAAVDA